MPANIGVPQKLLHESTGHRLTIELTDGSMCRGLLTDAEDNMNLQLSGVTMTNREGRISKLEFIYIRGSKIRLVILPDMLKNAPIFHKFNIKNKTPPSTTPIPTISATRGGGGMSRGRGNSRGGRGRGSS